VVANTHLFFHPAAGHIRTMHAATIALEATAFAEAAAAGGGAEAAVLFCGDFNSDLNDTEGVCGKP
jgi:endonuclease/exonuclease/phosphatase family metal-dependent hydrolase